MAILYPGGANHQLPGKSTTLLAARIINVHTMVWDLHSCENYFAKAGNPYSHFGTGPNGEVFQWQDLTYRAASDLNGNNFCISIENADKGVGYPTWSGSDVPRFTAAQAESLARLVAWLCTRFNIPPVIVPNSLTSSRGPGYHRHGINPWRVQDGILYSNSYGKVCPGDRRIAQFRDEIIPRVHALMQKDWFDMATKEELEAIVAASEQRIIRQIIGNKPLVVAFDDVTPGDPDHWYAIGARVRTELTQGDANQGVAEGTLRWWDSANPAPLRVPRATLESIPLIADESGAPAAEDG